MSMFPIASAVGTGSSGNITISNIPQTFQHLQIRIFARMDGGGAYFANASRFNGDTGTNYGIRFYGVETTTVSVSGSNGNTLFYSGVAAAGSSDARIYGATILDIYDYSSTTKTKAVRTFHGVNTNGNGAVGMNTGTWNSTAAITSFSLLASFGNWTNLTRVDVYGIGTSFQTGA